MRRKAREVAVQTLYALDFVDTNEHFQEYSLLNQYQEILSQIAESDNIDPYSSLYAFAEELVKNAIINLEEIELKIDNHVVNWSYDCLARLDRSILHIAVYELLYTDTPPAVIINEAIEISKKFCSESTGKFVNGILDAINKEIKEDAHPYRPS
ncbi:MAG: transcription antitermination factor NusB [Candidatus Cloacimonadaceae bacterium]